MLLLALGNKAIASFFAGNLSPVHGTDDQCVCRIYDSAYTYRTQQGECIGDANTKIHITGFLSTSSISVKTSETKTKISLDSIWGFKTGEYKFRVFNKRVYQILATDSITIYRGIGKFYRKYYFSKNLDSTIYWFSKNNLRKIFANDYNFLKILDSGIKVHQLLLYDVCDEQFSIHRLLTGNSP
ncbi:MAG: hypothetical protein AAGE93_09965 [Bacteroidota bacterium]